MDDDAAALQQEIARLKNAIHHLHRSNAEMRDHDAADPDLVEAIAENKDVIAKYEAKIVELENALPEGLRPKGVDL